MRKFLFVFTEFLFVSSLVFAGGIHDLSIVSHVGSRYATDTIPTPSRALKESPLMQGKTEISLSIFKDGKTPEVRLFEDKGDIAYRINKLYFGDPNPQRFVKSKFLGLRLKALDANGDKLQLTVVGDPNEVTFSKEILRSELESGKEIKMDEHKKKSVPFLADAYADSEITLKFNTETKKLEIPKIKGKMKIESFAIGYGSSEKSLENLTTELSEKRIVKPPFSK